MEFSSKPSSKVRFNSIANVIATQNDAGSACAATFGVTGARSVVMRGYRLSVDVGGRGAALKFSPRVSTAVDPNTKVSVKPRPVQ